METDPRRDNRLRLILTDEHREQAPGLFPVRIDYIGWIDRPSLRKLTKQTAAKPPPYAPLRPFLPTNCAEEPFFGRAVNAASKLAFCEQSEPAFHQVQPRGRGGREVNVETGSFGQPVLN